MGFWRHLKSRLWHKDCEDALSTLEEVTPKMQVRLHQGLAWPALSYDRSRGSLGLPQASPNLYGPPGKPGTPENLQTPGLTLCLLLWHCAQKAPKPQPRKHQQAQAAGCRVTLCWNTGSEKNKEQKLASSLFLFPREKRNKCFFSLDFYYPTLLEGS